jgi:hypothetical protein
MRLKFFQNRDNRQDMGNNYCNWVLFSNSGAAKRGVITLLLDYPQISGDYGHINWSLCASTLTGQPGFGHEYACDEMQWCALTRR